MDSADQHQPYQAQYQQQEKSSGLEQVSAGAMPPKRSLIRLGKAINLLQGGIGSKYDCNPNSNSVNGCR